MPKHAAIPPVTSITSKTTLERRIGISESEMAEPTDGEPFVWLGLNWGDQPGDDIGVELAEEWRDQLRGSEK